MTLFKTLFGNKKKDEEIKQFREELFAERKKNLNAIQRINQRIGAEISDLKVEFVIKNIHDIKEGK